MQTPIRRANEESMDFFQSFDFPKTHQMGSQKGARKRRCLLAFANFCAPRAFCVKGLLGSVDL
jgi:hypothetical protein